MSKRTSESGFKKFNKREAQEFISGLLDKHKITVRSISAGANGRAWLRSREVKIPEAKNIEKFCVALHEIGHIILKVRSKPSYEQEYYAEKFAIETANALGYDTTEYAERARDYVLMCLAKAHARKVNLARVPQAVREFIRHDIDAWEGKRVWVSRKRKGAAEVFITDRDVTLEEVKTHAGIN